MVAEYPPMVRCWPSAISFWALRCSRDRLSLTALVSSDAQPLSYALVVYLFDAVVIAAISLLAYRITLARKMVSQYPWLYERAGLLDVAHQE